MYIFLLLAGALAVAMFNTLSAKYVRAGKKLGYSQLFVLGFSFTSAAVYLGYFWMNFLRAGYVHIPLAPIFWKSFVVMVLLNVGATILVFSAYKYTDVGVVGSLYATTPLIAIISALLVLGELPSVAGLIGIAVVVFSIYILYLKTFSLRNMLHPFSKLKKDKGAWYALIAAALVAVGIPFGKQAIVASDPLTFSFFAITAIGIIVWFIDMFRSGMRKFVRQFRHVTPLQSLALGALFTFSALAINISLLYDVVPQVIAIFRTSAVFQVFFGFYLLGQRESLVPRLVGSIGVVLGVIIIAVA